MAIKTIAIVHHVHTDFGYTDHPCRTQREHIKYIDQAVEYVLRSSDYPEGARFAWTQEQLYPVRQWWEQASDAQKERFFQAIGTGRLEITGTPFNVTAFLSKEEWETAMDWIPEELWEKCRITGAMQIDVNGMHTQGMLCAYGKGVRNLWIGPNSYYGVPPMPTPSAFRWRIDTDKELFVWLNASYNNGFFLFNENWRQGPVPNYSDLRYRAPEEGDIWAADEASILAAHALCLENLAMIEGAAQETAEAKTDGFTKNRVFGGYALETFPVSVTSQWRVDNDPPFYPLVDFVRRWNEMGLQPRLVLCTAGQAMEMVKQELGEDLPVYTGEWIDWWANGNASLPVEMSVNRQAKRVLQTAHLPMFGPMTAVQKQDARSIMENICLYDEHCFSSWQSVSAPYSFANRSQMTEKSRYAYRALDGAQCLLADRVRPLAEQVRNEIVIWNPCGVETSAVIELPVNCMRGEYHSVFCRESEEILPVEYMDGAANFLRPSDPSQFGEENVSRTFSDRCEKQEIRFGPVLLPAYGCLHMVPHRENCEQLAALFTKKTETDAHKGRKPTELQIETDEKGWPINVRFAGQAIPVIDGSFGELLAVKASGFAPRWTFKDIFETDDADERERMRAEQLYEEAATYENTDCIPMAGVIQYEQRLCHGDLNYGKRILRIDPYNRRVTLELRIDRKSDFAPEVLFLKFRAPGTGGIPHISNAGRAFRPGVDQLPGSCMDFYAMDGWIHYPNRWLLNCRDNALVSFGETSVVSRKKTFRGSMQDIYIRLFDNIWDTNFNANASGMMQFTFTAAAGITLQEAERTAQAFDSEPVVLVKMGYKSQQV